MKKEELIESIIKSIKDFDAEDQNTILHSVTISVIDQRKELIEARNIQLKQLQDSLDNIPVILKI